MTKHPKNPSLTQHSNRLVAILTMLLIISSTGCQSVLCWTPPWKRHHVTELPYAPQPTYSTFVSPQFQLNVPYRVLMLPSGKSPGSYLHNQRAIDQLASQLRQRGVFEIVTPADVHLVTHPDNLLQGEFDEREIASLSRHFNADAVALVRVNELRAYAPLRTSITMVIVDSAESVVTFAVDGIWDTANQDTQHNFREYVLSHQASPGIKNSGTTDHSPIELQSPTALFAFAAADIAGALNSASY